MAQQHMERLGTVDASFLTNETDSAHMHIGAVMVFEGSPPPVGELIEHVRSRIHLVPRFRQKVAFAPLGTGRPFWVDDNEFDLAYHVRASGLPAPGSDTQLNEMAARVFGQQLDRSRPLWEMWLVHGLRGNRFALISKTHHTMVDGVSGVDIATVLFDLDPASQRAQAQPWLAHPEPGRAELVARDAESAISAPTRIVRRLAQAASHPADSVKGATERARGLGEALWTFTSPAPDVPLNVTVGPHRRYRWVRTDLADFKRVKTAFGGTVNDVVLAVVAGALRRWLHTRGVRTDGLELRAQVPVSVREADEHGQLGNKIAAMRAPLPVSIEDPIARLRAVAEATADLKASRQVLGAEVITRLNDFAPPTLLAQSARINGSPRLFNLVVTNVPGPQVPLFMLGRKLFDLYPVAFLWPNHALAIAAMSYNGRLGFGLLGDYDAMDDIEVVATGIEQALASLTDAADQIAAADQPTG